MDNLIDRIANCIERGKINAASPHPPDMTDQDGADELTIRALQDGISPNDILSKGLILGMQVVGKKFRNNEIYLPDVLMSANAMTAAMSHLKPYFTSGDVQYKGSIVIGTVAGDLHDIGKNIVGMFFEGSGWEVIDLGVDVAADKFVNAIEKHKPVAVGLSALLTTTMPNMAALAKEIKNKHPEVKVLIGGAVVNEKFADNIGADAYSPNPQGAIDYLETFR